MTVPALRELAAARGPLRLVGNASATRLTPDLLAAVEPFDTPRWSGLFDDAVPLPDRDGDAVVLLRDRACAARLRAAGWSVLLDADPLPTDPDAHVAAHLLAAVGRADRAEYWRGSAYLRARPSRSGQYAVVHPGSGSPRKNWPVERFADVIRALRLPAIVTVGAADGDVGERLLRLSAGATTLADDLSLEELASLLAGAALYVGNDSGVSHVAGALGTPTVAVFGPTRAATWAPWGPRVAIVEAEEWATVDEVLGAACSLLAGVAG